MPTLITRIRQMNCPRLSTVFVFIVCTVFSLLASCDMFADVDQPPVNSSKVPGAETITSTSEDGSVITVTKDKDSGEILSRALAVNSSVEVIKSKAYMNEGLTHVSISDSVVSIEKDAFACNILESVSIPPSVKSISEGAFRNNRLTSVEIRGENVSIGKGAFTRNSDLKEISINQKVLNRGDISLAFDDIDEIRFKDPNSEKSIKPIGRKFEEVRWSDGTVVKTVKDSFGKVIRKTLTVPLKYTVIREGLYKDEGLTHVKIHPGVTRIEDYAFAGNRLSEVIIPEGAVFVGPNAFGSNAPLRRIILSQDIRNRTQFNGLPRGVAVIFENHDGAVISKNAYIEKLIQGDGSILEIHHTTDGNVEAKILKVSPKVTHIAENAYSNRKLTGVVISPSVVSIGESAFSGNKLKKLIIPKSVKRIEKYAFSNNALESVDTSESMVEFIGEKAFHANKLTSIHIPASLKTIEQLAFFGNDNVASVDIPDTLDSLGVNAFSAREFILSPELLAKPGIRESITIFTGLGKAVKNRDGEKMKWDGGVLITDSSGKTRVYFPPSPPRTSIETGEFKGKSIDLVTIPDDVTVIKAWAFAINNLIEVIIPKKVTRIEEYAFSGNRSLERVSIPEGVTEIQQYAFADHDLKSLVIPSTVKSIGNNAFEGDVISFFDGEESDEKSLVGERRGLGRLTMRNGVESIGDKAFIFNKLEEAVIPPSVTSIGVGAFKHGKLRSLIFKEGGDRVNMIDRIGKQAFWDNALESLDIPPFVRTIGELAFAKNKLKKIVIGESVESIEGFAFADNPGLSSVELQRGLRSIGDGAFSGTNLSSITIPETVESIGYDAFPNSLKTVVIGKDLLDDSEDTFAPTYKKVKYYSDKVGGNEITPSWASSYSD